MIGIRVRFDWIPATPEWRGAIRASDAETWDTARWCRTCLALGFDHDDVGARLEAERLGEWTSVRVVACAGCGVPVCDLCAGDAGKCKRCRAAEGRDA